MINYKKKYLKYKKKYLETKKITGGENSKIKDYFNNVKDYFYNKICDNIEFTKNITVYRVVYNDVYFYNNNNGKMVKSNEIADLNGSWEGILSFIDNNLYIDLGMNEYIPAIDKETGDILVVTESEKCLPLKKKDYCQKRSSLPVPLADIIKAQNKNLPPIE